MNEELGQGNLVAWIRFDFQQTLILEPHTSLSILTLVTAEFKADAAGTEVGSFLTVTLRVRSFWKVEILAERRTLRLICLEGDSLLSILCYVELCLQKQLKRVNQQSPDLECKTGLRYTRFKHLFVECLSSMTDYTYLCVKLISTLEVRQRQE